MLKMKDFNSIGGESLLEKYKSSPLLLLSTLFPEHEWLPWKFSVVPRNFWENSDNQRKFVEWAAKELKIKEMKDWYQIKAKVSYFHEISDKCQGFL
jgi:hypothetical protein